MAGRILNIAFDFERSKTLPRAVSLAPQRIVDDLLTADIQHIYLEQLPGQYADHCRATGGGVLLWVDHDAKYLAESYLHLERIVALGVEETHYTFLDDGGLQLTAILSEGTANLRIDRCPGLDVANLSTYSLTIPVTDYLGTWREMAAILYQASCSRP
jgi:hypothetical protein